MLNRLSLNRIGLNRIGLNRIGKPSGGSSDRPYIDPKVLNSLCGVWIMDQNTNESESRNIIKNKIADRGGDLELLNFGYKLNSGYNGYAIDFTSWSRLIGIKVFSNKFIIENKAFNCAYYVRDKGEDLDEFKAKITNHTDGIIRYGYINQNGVITYLDITPDNSNRVITFPKSYNSIEGLPNHICGFQTPMFVNTGLTIEQLPLYEGALVTDGKDDMIVSQKTVQEMGITNEITVVSMIHHISNSVYHTNYIRSNTRLLKNYLFETSCGKSFIYGYTATNVGVTGTPNGKLTDVILGDKKDLYTVASNYTGIDSDSKFSIEGCINNVDNSLRELSEVAVYWTFIANKVLTTDEINQIIGYFKLDKYVTPQVIYDVKRQGLTNDTPAADWYLKDFSGNGYDMQLYNYAKKGNSGIGKYEADYSTWIKTEGVTSTSFGFKIIEPTHNYWLLYTSNVTIPAHKVLISGIPEGGELRYLGVNILINGINELPEMAEHPSAIGFTLHRGTTQPGDWVGLSVEQIPDYEGALVSDGKDDYGKAEGLPIFKDYTVAVDRAIETIYGSVISKSQLADNGAFIFEQKHLEQDTTSSFGRVNSPISDLNINRKISYQSKYLYNGNNISVGTGIDGNDIWLATIRDNDTRFSSVALYSMLLFPYSLSEFLLERQLKKYKLGTLYPDMVEFRPIVKSNVEYSKVGYLNYTHNLATIKSGYYVNIGDTIAARIVLNNTLDEIVNAKVNGQECEVVNVSSRVFDCKFIITSNSPQKIDITIDEYIRFEDIVQPYPVLLRFKDENGNEVSWGGKLRVGSTVTYIDHFQNNNLLKELYKVSAPWINNRPLATATEVVERQMIYRCTATWIKDNNEPKCILSPSRLRIPNSSLKILGYVPDLTGKGNHGKLNNFAYTEDSGVAADGSIKFDGTDDHITIPTLAHGGKCVMMKVNWSNDGMLYDQRPIGGHNTFGIYTGENHPAYSARNNGSTYIDGILNTNIIPSNLAGITHNITAVNDTATDNSTTSPRLGTSFTNATFSNMSLYEFMLFPDISSEEEIKELNDIIGIEGGYVESPDYYWDAYGKTNSDADRATIIDQVSKDPANALTANNFAFNEESGYSQIVDTALFKNWVVLNGTAYIEYTLVNDTTINITKSNRASIDAFYCRTNVKKKSYYRITGLKEGQSIQFGFTNNIICTVESDGVYEVDWSLVSKNYQELGTTFVGDCNIIIEQVAQYPNGLVSDGVEDYLINTVIPAFTDFTVIVKRTDLRVANPTTFFIQKGLLKGWNLGGAFSDGHYEGSAYYCSSFGRTNDITSVYNKEFFYQTPTNYNGVPINIGDKVDSNGLIIGAGISSAENGIIGYYEGVFYKLMLYTKTIDQLSINMLKNLFERDELIDVTNPIFKKQ